MATTSASKKVYDYVLEQISSKNYKPGDKIPTENELSLLCCSSRVSVRKALDELVGSGLLIKRRGSGTYVSQRQTTDVLNRIMPVVEISDYELLDLLEFRIGFETSNVEMLAKTITSETLDKLEFCYKQMVKYQNDVAQFHTYDYQFHQIIANDTKNTFVIKITILIMNVLKSQQARLYQKIGPHIGLEYHGKILSALKDKDFDIAAMYMNKHMKETIREVKNVLEEEKLQRPAQNHQLPKEPFPPTAS